MCGIAGIIKRAKTSDITELIQKEVLSELLYVTALRGQHSTGMFTVPWEVKKPIKYFKKAEPAFNFLNNKAYKTLLNEYSEVKYLIGHGRKSTTGTIVDKNAHPFNYKQITLVHNGVIGNRYELAKLAGEKYPDVDSISVAMALAVAPISTVIPMIEGAFSLVWYDGIEKRLNFIRNEERPLAFARIKGDNNPVLFASEMEALKFILDRNNLEADKWFSLNPGTLLSIHKDESINFSHIYDGKVVESNYYGNYERKKAQNRAAKYPVHKITAKSKKAKKKTKTQTSKLVNQSNIKSQEQLLLELGFTMNEEISFTYLGYEEYTRSKKNAPIFGTLTGIMEDEPYHLIKVHKYPKKDLKGIDVKKQTFLGEVISASLSAVDSKAIDNGRKWVLNMKAENVVSWGEEEDSYRPKQLPAILEESETAAEIIKDAFEGFYRGRNGILLNENDFNHFTKNGCAGCSGNIDIKDHELIGWTDCSQPMCVACCVNEKWVDSIFDNPSRDALLAQDIPQ